MKNFARGLGLAVFMAGAAMRRGDVSRLRYAVAEMHSLQCERRAVRHLEKP